jgi:hypothetical protein
MEAQVAVGVLRVAVLEVDVSAHRGAAGGGEERLGVETSEGLAQAALGERATLGGQAARGILLRRSRRTGTRRAKVRKIQLESVLGVAGLVSLDPVEPPPQLRVLELERVQPLFDRRVLSGCVSVRHDDRDQRDHEAGKGE